MFRSGRVRISGSSRSQSASSGSLSALLDCGGSGARCAARLLVWAALLTLVLRAAVGFAQSSVDGALRGRVVGVSGAAVPGARVVASLAESGFAEQVVCDARGGFLLVRLPPGEYTLSVQPAPGIDSVAEVRAVVSAGEVTELPAPLSPGGPMSAGGVSRGAEPMDLVVPEGEQEQLLQGDASGAPGLDVTTPERSGTEQGSVPAVNSSETRSRIDGVSAEESFGAQPLGTGVEEDGSAGGDAEPEPSAGPGSGWQSVESGGRRAGAAYTFSQAAVREFRTTGQGDAAAYGSALYGHGVGGVTTAVSRSGDARLHGMAFYTVRDSAWAAANQFAVATRYSNGAVSSSVMKPHDLRQQFGGRIGGPLRLRWPGGAVPLAAAPRDRSGGVAGGSQLFYFYAFDMQRRGFPALSSPGYAGFYTLSAIQAALLANRGVSSAKTVAALNYLDSLTGEVDRRADQTVNFARLDWHRRGGEQMSLEYNRARWSNPAGARSSPVVNRGRASLGSSFGSVDAGVARWVRFVRPGLSNEVRVQFGRELQYEAPQTPLPQEPGVGPGDLPPEVSIGPQGLVFGTPAALGRRAYPDERRFEVADVLAWVHRGNLLQLGADFSVLSDYTDSLTNAEGTFSYDSGATNGKAGGLVDWITDYTFNVHAYPNGGCPSIGATVHDFCFRSYSQSFGQQGLSFGRQEWAGFVQDDWRVSPSLTLHAGAQIRLRVAAAFRSGRMPRWMPSSGRAGQPVCFPRTGTMSGLASGWCGSRSASVAAWCARAMESTSGTFRELRSRQLCSIQRRPVRSRGSAFCRGPRLFARRQPTWVSDMRAPTLRRPRESLPRLHLLSCSTSIFGCPQYSRAPSPWNGT